MKSKELEIIKRISNNIAHEDKRIRLQMAKEICDLAGLIIKLKRAEDESNNNC